MIGTGYDASGNVTSVTPPGRPAHASNYTASDLESDYTPPGGASFNTHTSYNLDQQVSSVSRPDGDFVTPTYDAAKGFLVVSRSEALLGPEVRSVLIRWAGVDCGRHDPGGHPDLSELELSPARTRR